jgi:COX assembly protein 2
MHPHLGLHNHPLCQAQILALAKCHSDHPWRKFLGTCNEARRVLDVCLGEEFEETRRENLVKRAQRQHAQQNAL